MSTARTDRAAERRRQAEALALAVAAASALPHRAPGPLLYPPFRTLLKR